VGPTTSLPLTAQAVDFLGRISMTTFLGTLLGKPSYILLKSILGRGDNLLSLAFLGIWIIMGIVKLSQVRDCWSQEPIFGEHSVITGAFARDHFFCY